MNNKANIFFSGLCVLLFFISNLSFVSDAFGQNPEVNNLFDLTLEELMDIEVYSVAKKITKLDDSATAVHVISEEDIRRSGATSLPEVLRLAPGLQVTRVNAHTWAIGMRGFANVFSNKLLVLIDGRTVYRPVFSGTFWDEHLIPLSDIKQIEVIRGPGATVWGSNAVNGVINIIRKSASESEGITLSVGSGNVEESQFSIIQATSLSEWWDLKLYGNQQRISSFEQADGGSAHDGNTYLSSGFRADGRLSDSDFLRVQGDVYRGSADDHQLVSQLEAPIVRDVKSSILDWGTNLMVNWASSQSQKSETNLQLYYDRFERESIPVDITADTIDLDFQHNYDLYRDFTTTYGFNWRLVHDDSIAGESVSFDPKNRTTGLFSSFLQGELSAIDDVVLTIGSKFEHNDYTGFEVQPSARGLVHLTDQSSLWLSIARAVRTPARTDRDLNIDYGTGLQSDGSIWVTSLSGNKSQNSENLLAIELGARSVFDEKISLDIATFVNRYDDLISSKIGDEKMRRSENSTIFETPTVFSNGVKGVAYGAESVVTLQAMEWWKLVGTYSWVKVDLDTVSDSDRVIALSSGAAAAENMFNLRSFVDLTSALQFDSVVYYLDRPMQNDIPSFIRSDFRLGWATTPAVSLDFVLHNAFDGKHRESVDPLTSSLASDVPRSFFFYLRVSL